MRTTEFFVILGHFLAFYPTENLENQNLKNEKSIWRCHHFTYENPKENDHMIYASCDIECDRNDFLSIWAISCPFTTLRIPKIKI